MIINICTNEETNKIFKGMNILLNYYPDASIKLGDREIYFGDNLEIFDYCDDTYTYSYFWDTFSNEDLDTLKDLGWFVSKNTHKWTIEV